MKKENQEKGMRISKQVPDPAVPNRARTEMKQENNSKNEMQQQNNAKNKKKEEKAQG